MIIIAKKLEDQKSINMYIAQKRLWTLKLRTIDRKYFDEHIKDSLRN